MWKEINVAGYLEMMTIIPEKRDMEKWKKGIWGIVHSLQTM